MTAIAEIIELAFDEGRVTTELQNPTPTQTAEAMRRLQQIITSIYGNDAGERLEEWPLGPFGRKNPSSLPAGNCLAYPPLNASLIAGALAAMTVYLPIDPSDGARVGLVDPFARLAAFPVTLDGNGRAIEGATTLTLNENSLNRAWFYRADLGNWVRITDLTLADEMPFPAEFDILFVTMLALRLAPALQNTLPPTTTQIISGLKRDFVNRYLQSAELRVTSDLAFNAKQTYNEYGAGFGSSNDYFNRGGGWSW